MLVFYGIRRNKTRPCSFRNVCNPYSLPFSHFPSIPILPMPSFLPFLSLHLTPLTKFIHSYQKPTDNKRKKLRLLTVKPLYLHLNLKETTM